MRVKSKKSKTDSAVTVIIYWSPEDACWVAHSIEFDQVGTGGRVVEALADLIRGVRALFAAAKRDESLNVFRRAPADVLALADDAEKLPMEVYEIAHRMAV